MGLRISTNVASINAQRHLYTEQRRAEHALQALASGSRIVNAGDDAAGWSVSENIKSQGRGLRAARQNAYNAMSLIQVSEGGLGEITSIMTRLRELGIQAASDTVSDVERGFLTNETNQLKDEAERIAQTTMFGHKKLLSGENDELEYHVGAFGGPENVIKYKMKADATGSTLGYDSIAVDTKDNARESLQKVDDAILKIGAMRADFGAVQSRLQSTVSNLDIQYENIMAAKSRISDADIAYESSEAAQAQVLQAAAVSTLAQANTLPMQAMKLIN